MRRERSSCCSLPVGWSALMRSPSETRCAGEDICGCEDYSKFGPRGWARLPPGGEEANAGCFCGSMRRLKSRSVTNETVNVTIKSQGDQTEQENQSDLDEALLDGDAQIATETAFDSEHENVAAIENRNREQIEDTEIEADVGHPRKKRCWTTLSGLPGQLNDADGTGQVSHRDGAVEETGEDVAHHPHKIPGLADGVFRRLENSLPLEIFRLLGNDADLPGHFTGTVHRVDGGNGHGYIFAIAAHDEMDRMGTRFGDTLHQLLEGDNGLAVHRDNRVARLDASLFGRETGSGLLNDRRNKREAEQVGNFCLRAGDAKRKSLTRAFTQHRHRNGGAGLDFLNLLDDLAPGRRLDRAYLNDLVARAGGQGGMVLRHGGNDRRFAEIGVNGHAD